MLAIRVDIIQIGGGKIHTNLPRFQRGVGISRRSNKGVVGAKLQFGQNRVLGGRMFNSAAIGIRG